MAILCWLRAQRGSGCATTSDFAVVVRLRGVRAVLPGGWAAIGTWPIEESPMLMARTPTAKAGQATFGPAFAKLVGFAWPEPFFG